MFPQCLPWLQLPYTYSCNVSTDAYLGYNSELGVLVFDPNHEPKTPLPPPPVDRQVPPMDTREQPAQKQTPKTWVSQQDT